jgi:arylformamidase
MRSLLVVLLLASPVLAADPQPRRNNAYTLLASEPQVRRDVAYDEPKNERQMLDVYSPRLGKDLPIVVWIHGGGWKGGDKGSVQKKPQAFNDKGFVFVSTTYRFAPAATVKQMTGDVAKAIRWAHDHAKEIGGDPERIFVMGHSAGAHLAALVCTDDSYLKAEGLSLSIIKGCVPVDVSVYDIPKRLKDGGSVPPATFKAIFGEDAEAYRALSPAAHVAKDKHIPPFLILHVADRAETKAQSHWFADKLKEAGVAAKVVAAEGKTHGTINSELGLPDDKPTKALFEFLDDVVMKRPAREP